MKRLVWIDPPPFARYRTRMADFTPHQKKIVERYYRHRNEIVLARLGDIATELYLATSEKKIEQLWKRAEKAMTALKVPPKIAEHILTQRRADILAKHLREWLEASPRSNL